MRSSRTSVFSAAALAIPSLCGWSTAAEVSIESIAPGDSVLIVSVSDAGRAMERMKKTSLWDLWQTDEFKDVWQTALEEADVDLNEWLTDLGVDEDSLSAPSGTFGLALFPVADEDTGATKPGMLGLADYGDKADKTNELLEAMLERGKEEDALEYEQDELLGRPLYSITFAAAEVEVEDEEDMGMGGMDPFAALPDPSDLLDGLRTMHIVRDEGVFMFASDLDTLTSAVEGEADEDGLAAREEYQAIRGHLGDVDGHMVLLTRDLIDVIGGPEQLGMMMMMFQPVIPAVLGDIRGMGAGMRLDGPTAMVEEPFVIYMPEGKGGIPALLDTTAPRGGLPSFVGPDTVNYVSMNFESNGVPGFIQGVLDAVPMLQMQFGDQLPEIMATIEQISRALGDEIHIVTTLTRPIRADSMQQYTAIRCSDAEALESRLAAIVPQMGLEPHDFLGSRIYSAPEGMAGMTGEEPPSLGLGGGFLFMGATASVQQALRSVSRADAASLRDDGVFQRAVGVLPDDPVTGWGFSRLVDTMEANMRVEQMATAEMLEQMREQFPDVVAEMEAEAEGGLVEELDFDLMRRHLGPIAWHVRPTDDGFVGAYYMLSAGEE